MLRFHPHKTALGAVKDGISFLGYRTYPWGIRVRGKSLRRFRKRLRQPQTLDKKVKTLLSYNGHLHFADPESFIYEDLKSIAFREEAFMN
jgi:hypothetical protein